MVKLDVWSPIAGQYGRKIRWRHFCQAAFIFPRWEPDRAAMGCHGDLTDFGMKYLELFFLPGLFALDCRFHQQKYPLLTP